MVDYFAIGLPVLWWYLLGNIIAHYMCIRSVFMLASECSSLTVTLVLTLRKFVSLIGSILYFNNTFTLWHCIGSGLVFAGTLMFTNFVRMACEQWSRAHAGRLQHQAANATPAKLLIRKNIEL
jgi:hypothetical protein